MLAPTSATPISPDMTKRERRELLSAAIDLGGPTLARRLRKEPTSDWPRRLANAFGARYRPLQFAQTDPYGVVVRLV